MSEALQQRSDGRQAIVAHYWMKPIPPRQFDWEATRGDPDLGCRVGYGATEDAAVLDLLELEEAETNPGDPCICSDLTYIVVNGEERPCPLCQPKAHEEEARERALANSQFGVGA